MPESLVNGWLSRLGFANVPAFSEWFLKKSEKADLVVALARAAPRILQLSGLTKQVSAPVVCERAIPFLNPASLDNSSVLLFDDTIIRGSTMAATYRLLNASGAKVNCAAIAVSLDTFIKRTEGGEYHIQSPYYTELKPDHLVKASAHQLDILHALEIETFLGQSKPYMYDFPLFEISLNSTIRQYSPKYIAQLLGETDIGQFQWPGLGTHDGVSFNFSIPVSRRYLADIFTTFGDALDWRVFSKVRVFVDYANLKLRFAPLVQTDSSPAKLLAGMSRGSTTDPLSELLITAVRPSDGREDTLRAGVHRAIVFALSCHLGVLAWSSIRRSELADTFANSIPDLMIEDATFLLGEQLAERVTELVQGYMRNPYYRSSLTFNSGGRTFRDTKQSNKTNIDSSGPLLRGTIISRLRRGDNLVPSSKRDAFENISYMIPTMTTVIDKEARSEDDSGRLLRGLTFSDFLILLNDDGVQTTENELSTALDELVDGGSLVPQLMVDVEKATIARAYRSGESAPANSTMVLRSIIQSLLKERLLAGLRPLSEIGFSKVFVILKLLTPKLPYRIGLRPFGCEPILDDGLLREWCYNHRIAELADDKGRKVVVAVDHPAPPSAWPMPGLEGVNLRDAFDYIAELDGLAAASSEDAPGLKMLILLSTCNTHQATFNACAWEMHAWLRFRDSNKDYNFDRVLSLLEAVNWEQVTLEAETRAAAQQPSLFDERSTKALVGPIRANLVAKSFRRIKLTTLYKHCRDYLSQYRFKRNIFYVDSSSIVASLGRHFASERSRYRFWQELFINDKRLDLGVNPMYQKLFDIMDPLEEAAWALMDIVQQVLVATESWPDDSSPTSTATFVDGINCYNRAIGLLHAVGKEAGRLKPFDTDAVVSESQIGKWVYECRLRFEELKTAFGFWIPIFDELSATPFSPGIFRKSRYVEDDLLRNHYLGMFDMLNSKISATEVKEQIARVMDEIGCFHEVTGNDCCLFVTETLTKAIEVVEAVRVRTVQYVNADGKGFGGVRAAITKGDCLKRRLSGTTLDDARLMLMDMDGTPDIPNTSYLLDRIKELLAQHSSLKVSDQTRGIAVDREIAIEYGGTTNDVELENKGLSNVGQWTVKTVSGEAYFYIPLE